MLRSLVKKWVSSVEAAEKNTTNQAQRVPTEKVTAKGAQLQTSENTSPEPKPKPVAQSESSVSSSDFQKRPNGRVASPVKWYDETKGFGFLEAEEGDLFFHVTDIVDGSIPAPKATYWYEVGKGKDGRPAAKNVATSPSPILEQEQEVDEIHDLYKWAYMPLFSRDKASKAISELSDLALPEDWRYRDSSNEDVDEFGVLRSYIRFSFTRLTHEGKITEGEQFAVFNTGLVDRFYEPIYALFEKNSRPTPKWKWKSFCVAGQGPDGKLLTRTFDQLPPAANFFTDLDDIYFDADAPFDEDVNHIVIDGIRRDRYPHEFLEKYAGGFSKLEYESSPNEYLAKIADALNEDDDMFRNLRDRLSRAISLARRRARWNYRAVVPQYYPRHNKMSFLLPLSLVNDSKIDAALVVQAYRIDGNLRYQGFTIFPLSYAYKNARLVAKPISDWLDPEKILNPDK